MHNLSPFLHGAYSFLFKKEFKVGAGLLRTSRKYGFTTIRSEKEIKREWELNQYIKQQEVN